MVVDLDSYDIKVNNLIFYLFFLRARKNDNSEPVTIINTNVY